MKWTKPPIREPSRDYFLDAGEWRLCKAFVGERVVYTLSRRVVLVRSSESLDELKEVANENRDEA